MDIHYLYSIYDHAYVFWFVYPLYITYSRINLLKQKKMEGEQLLKKKSFKYYISSLLHHRMKVTITDGRVIVGDLEVYLFFKSIVSMLYRKNTTFFSF